MKYQWKLLPKTKAYDENRWELTCDNKFTFTTKYSYVDVMWYSYYSNSTKTGFKPLKDISKIPKEIVFFIENYKEINDEVARFLCLYEKHPNLVDFPSGQLTSDTNKIVLLLLNKVSSLEESIQNLKDGIRNL